MTTRSRHAAALGRALSAATGIHCELVHDASDRTWQVRWSNGPTVTEMRALVAAHARRAAPTLEGVELRYQRDYSDLEVAVQLLWWLAQDHDDDAGPVDLWLPLHSGVDVLPGSPERAPTLVRRRAEVLVEHGWSAGTSSLGVGRELEDHARDGGWRHVGAWLDRLAGGPDARPVSGAAGPRPGSDTATDPDDHSPPVDLAAYRQRRNR